MRERLAVGLAVVVVGAAVVAALAEPHDPVVSTNSQVTESGREVPIDPDGVLCAPGIFVPVESVSARLHPRSEAEPGPPLLLSMRDADDEVVRRGRLGGGYRGQSVEVPLSPLDRDVDGRICVRNEGSRRIWLAGNKSEAGGPPIATETFRVDLLAGEDNRIITQLGTIARRASLLKADFVGPWTLYAGLAALLACGAAGVALVLRGGSAATLARVPRAAWGCALIAIAHAAVWATLTPSFQVPDEPVHAGYVEHVAQTGGLPPRDRYYDPSDAQRPAFEGVRFTVGGKPPWSPERDRAVEQMLDEPLDPVSEAGAGYAGNQPPLYYVTAVPAYWAGAWGDALDRIYMVRLWGALLAGLTVLFVFAFLRELLPGHPFAWTLGALAVALQPVFAFISGGVNNDAAIFAEGAALLYLIALIFRRGLTARRGIAVAAVTAAAIATKAQAFGLLPGVVVALAIAGWRAAPTPRARLRAGAIAGGLALAAVVGFVAVRGGVEGATAGFFEGSSDELATISGQLTYAWQFLAPGLPFMEDHFDGQYPLYEVMFRGLVGRFGWSQYEFDAWVSWVGLGIALFVIALAARELWLRRERLRARWPEALTYIALAAGLWALVLVAGYRYGLVNTATFEQARYLFPLLGLYGATVALAARGAGRWGLAFAGSFVVVAAGQALLAVLLTIERYYV